MNIYNLYGKQKYLLISKEKFYQQWCIHTWSYNLRDLGLYDQFGNCTLKPCHSNLYRLIVI